MVDEVGKTGSTENLDAFFSKGKAPRTPSNDGSVSKQESEQKYTSNFDRLKLTDRETADQLAHNMKNIQEGLALTLDVMNPGKRDQLLTYLRELGNGMWGVMQGEEVKERHVERVITAIGGASALTAIEPSREYTERGQKMVNALRDRNGVK